MIKRLLLIISIILISSPCFAATYYVATSANGGNDSNTGLVGFPWLTIQHAADTVARGDTVYVGAGTFAETVTISTATSGTTMINFIASTATTKVQPTAGANVRKFIINAEYIRVEGFNVTNSTDTCDEDAVPCNPLIDIQQSNVQVVGNYVYNARQDGIGSSNSFATRTSSVTVSNNLIEHSQYGMVFAGDSWVVSGNEVKQLYAYTFEGYVASPPARGSWDCDYMRSWGTGSTVSNNYFHGTTLSECTNPGDSATAHVDCLQTFGGGASAYLSNFLYTRNICTEFHSTMIEGHSGALTTLLTFSNNVWANGFGTTNQGFDAEDVSYLTFTNNTFYNVGTTGGGCGGLLAYTPDLVTNSTMTNNIISCSASAGTYIFQYFDATDSEDYNLAYKPGGTAYCDCNRGDSSVFGTHDVVDEDPLFVNPSNVVGPDGIPFTPDDGLRLQLTSPARHTGLGGADMGAYSPNNMTLGNIGD